MSKDKQEVGRLGLAADRATRASTEPASGLGPDGRVSTDAGHTPGPLHIDGGADWVIRAASGEALGEVYSRADAALWASAPELLEALAKLVELDSDGEAGCRVDPIEYGEALNAGRALIARARGETA